MKNTAYSKAEKEAKSLDAMDEAAAISQLLESLQALIDISGEATIPLDSVKSVRRMGEFLEIRQKAQEVVHRVERRSFSDIRAERCT